MLLIQCSLHAVRPRLSGRCSSLINPRFTHPASASLIYNSHSIYLHFLVFFLHHARCLSELIAHVTKSSTLLRRPTHVFFSILGLKRRPTFSPSLSLLNYWVFEHGIKWYLNIHVSIICLQQRALLSAYWQPVGLQLTQDGCHLLAPVMRREAAFRMACNLCSS